MLSALLGGKVKPPISTGSMAFSPAAQGLCSFRSSGSQEKKKKSHSRKTAAGDLHLPRQSCTAIIFCSHGTRTILLLREQLNNPPVYQAFMLTYCRALTSCYLPSEGHTALLSQLRNWGAQRVEQFPMIP